MRWVRLDEQFTDHPKVLQAGPLAGWLYVCGLTYCSRYLTDGFIPAAQVRRLAAVNNAAQLAQRLVDVGLWEVKENGYLVHDYLDYQQGSAIVRRERDAAKTRMRRLRSDDVRANRERSSSEVLESTRVEGEGEGEPELNSSVRNPEISKEPERVAGGAAAPAAAATPEILQAFHEVLAGQPGYEPSDRFLRKVATFVSLDLEAEAMKLASWLAENPKKRCSTLRVMNWLERAEKDRTEGLTRYGEHRNVTQNADARHPRQPGRAGSQAVDLASLYPDNSRALREPGRYPGDG